MIRSEVVLIYDTRKVISRLGYKTKENMIHHFYQEDLSKIPREDLFIIPMIMFGCIKPKIVSKMYIDKIYIYQNNS